MKNKLNQLWEGIIGGLDSSDKGFSSKKKAAFTVIVCIVAAHAKWILMGNFAQLELVLTIDYGFISLCFGLNTIQKIKEKK